MSTNQKETQRRWEMLVKFPLRLFAFPAPLRLSF
jgi:hypothetical protein